MKHRRHGFNRQWSKTRLGGMLAALVALACLPAAGTAQMNAAAQQEVESLLRTVGSSGCQFLRSGTAHSAAEAQQHLQKKYVYMVKRNLLVSAEDFIDKAATRSSMSGELYGIRCGDAQPVRSDEWLRAKLQLLRQPLAPR